MNNNILASRLSAIKPSPTIAMTARAAALKKQGRDILSLSAGEPDFKTPQHIIDAATNAMNKGFTRYTSPAGLPEFRDAVARKLKRDNGLTYSADDIHVGVGGKQVIANALMATINHGDEVIIPAPYWVSYVDLVLLFGGKPVVITGHEKNNFKITPQDLEKAITPKTKWFIFNNPSNPTGMGYDKGELQALGAVLANHESIYILTDEIYEFLVYDDFRFTAFAEANPALFDRTITLNGLSKAYAMTGFRVGYGAGPRAIISAMNMVQSQLTSSTSTVSQWAGVAALDGNHDFIATHNAEFKKRRDMVLAALLSIDGISCVKPNGAFYLYPCVKHFIGKKTKDGKTIDSDDAMAEYLLERAEVALVAGSAFGLSPYIRISYATSMDILQKAMTRVKESLAELR
ncbi:MAG: pyridoxal phosphate-dependent aminotransferase [Hydrotalea sp.]|nr:pyridoxal phosphate-dependent aminotransferase [Hydrotalea sp.]